MNGHYSNFARSFDAEAYIGVGSFQTNGAAAPTAAQLRKQIGLPFTVTHEATGILNVLFDPKKFKLPSSAFYAEAHLVGPIATVGGVRIVANELHLPACRLRLQLVDGAGAAVAPPAAAAGVFVHFMFVGTNNTGK